MLQFRLNLLDHYLQSIKFLTLSEVSKIKLLVLHFSFQLRSGIVYTPAIPIRQLNLSVTLELQQVQAEHVSVRRCQVAHVQIELFLCHLWRPRYVYLFLDPELLPKDWHGAADLHVRNGDLVVKAQDLFFLDVVADIAIIVDSSCIVASACSFVHSAR